MGHTDFSRLDASELTDPRRVAVLAVHTSPLAQPGIGDAGGMNVYVLQSALHLARRGVQVEIFTRATASTDPPVVRNLLVRYKAVQAHLRPAITLQLIGLPRFV